MKNHELSAAILLKIIDCLPEIEIDRLHILAALVDLQHAYKTGSTLTGRNYYKMKTIIYQEELRRTIDVMMDKGYIGYYSGFPDGYVVWGGEHDSVDMRIVNAKLAKAKCAYAVRKVIKSSAANLPIEDIKYRILSLVLVKQTRCENVIDFSKSKGSIDVRNLLSTLNAI
jgi:hypothetical protein